VSEIKYCRDLWRKRISIVHTKKEGRKEGNRIGHIWRRKRRLKHAAEGEIG